MLLILNMFDNPKHFNFIQDILNKLLIFTIEDHEIGILLTFDSDVYR